MNSRGVDRGGASLSMCCPKVVQCDAGKVKEEEKEKEVQG